MAKLISNKFKYFFFLVTGLVIGVILGSTGLTALISYRIDEYHQIIKQLESDIIDKGTRLEKLEERLNEAQEEQKYILKEIQIVLNDIDNEDTFDQISLVQHIKEKYNDLIGREVKTLDLDILGNIIDKRIFKLDEKEFQLTVEKMYLTDILKIWVSIELLSESE
jgi:vacuolar-type H+-ATPase subunit I/STV1